MALRVDVWLIAGDIRRGWRPLTRTGTYQPINYSTRDIAACDPSVSPPVYDDDGGGGGDYNIIQYYNTLYIYVITLSPQTVLRQLPAPVSFTPVGFAYGVRYYCYRVVGITLSSQIEGRKTPKLVLQ